jgi:Phycobilisome protein
MLDVYYKIVSDATHVDIESVKSSLERSSKLLNAVKHISENISKITTDSFRALLAEDYIFFDLNNDAFSVNQLGELLNNLDLILRCVNYVIIAGDVRILEHFPLKKICKKSVKDNLPVELAIQIMRIISIDVVNAYSNTSPDVYGDVNSDLEACFNHVMAACTNGDNNIDSRPNDAIEKLNEIRVLANKGNPINEYEWDCGNYTKWVEQDKLTQTLSKYDIEDRFLFEESAIRFFKSWNQMPLQDKKDVWREREVMAALYEQMMQHWKTLPSFRSIAVADRIVDGENQLTGILIFDFALGNEYYQLWDIPQYIRVKSSISELTEEEELIPIQLEWMSKTTRFSKEVAGSLSIKPSLPTLLSVQSGDSIVGCNTSGRLNTNQSVTLTTFVIPQNSSDISDVSLLTVGHGFKGGYTDIYTCELNSSKNIGAISYNSPVQEEIADRIDISLIKPTDTIQINTYLKWANIAPKAPVSVVKRGMCVQMYGGISKHQVGHIDYSQMLDGGAISSVIPSFTAIINAQPGDSGSLLIAGHGVAGDPHLDGKERGYSDAYLDSIRFAMLGILIEGNVRGTFQNSVTFRPIDTIFLRLKIKPYLNGS